MCVLIKNIDCLNSLPDLCYYDFYKICFLYLLLFLGYLFFFKSSYFLKPSEQEKKKKIEQNKIKGVKQRRKIEQVKK